MKYTDKESGISVEVPDQYITDTEVSTIEGPAGLSVEIYISALIPND